MCANHAALPVADVNVSGGGECELGHDVVYRYMQVESERDWKTAITAISSMVRSVSGRWVVCNR